MFERLDEVGRLCGSGAVSRPLATTCFAPACTPALSSTSFSRTPRHFALPIAPLASLSAADARTKKPRLLPEH